MGRNDGMTEGRKDGRTDKANTKCPLAILWRGHKNCTLYEVGMELRTDGRKDKWTDGCSDYQMLLVVLSGQGH